MVFARWLAVFTAGVALVCAFSSAAFASETITYTYDAQGQVVAVGRSGSVNNGQSAAISYDDAGNRTNYTMTGAGGGGSGVTFSISDASATEGSAMTFTVTKSGTASGSLSVNYATSNGTATAGTDYTAKSGTLTFTAAQTSKTFTVSTIPDSTFEGNETFNVTLSSPTSPATLADAVGIGTIIDDDAWSSSLTAGSATACSGYCYIYGYLSYTTGSMTNLTFEGYTVSGVYTMVSAGGTTVVLAMSGTPTPPNSGWTSITIPGVATLARASATYSGSGSVATWTWSNTSHVTSGTVTIQ